MLTAFQTAPTHSSPEDVSPTLCEVGLARQASVEAVCRMGVLVLKFGITFLLIKTRLNKAEHAVQSYAAGKGY